MSEQDIIRKVKLLREMQRMAEDAQAEAEALKDEIKAYMGSSESVESSRVDTKALTKALPDVAAAFTRKSIIRRFVVA